MKNRNKEAKKTKKKYTDTIVDTQVIGGYMVPNGPEFCSTDGAYLANARPQLPPVHMMDANGHVFQAQTYYKPLPNSAPVAVPVPNQTVQLTPIVTPLSVVPFMSQDQPLYQYYEDDEY